MDVGNTVLILAQYVNENHVLSDSSLCAVGSQIMNESQRKRESRPHSSLFSASESPPARWLRHSLKVHE